MDLLCVLLEILFASSFDAEIVLLKMHMIICSLDLCLSQLCECIHVDPYCVAKEVAVAIFL